jgi:DNA polymerase-3 subunit delta'
MPLADVQHQPSAVLTLQGALASRQVPHAWLFFGPDGVGKELAATGLAQALTCPKAPFVGCGTCSSCVRVARGNHPDVTWLMPEDELVRRGLMGKSDFSSAPSRDIRIEQVRRLQARLALRPLEATYKLALIVSAHSMNPPAQNALLKTLEEPPRDTVLVLVSSAPDKLLPTIRSRCSKAGFGPLPSRFIAERVRASKKGLDEKGAEQVAAMAGGSLARALELDAAAVVEQSELITRFEALERSDARGWLMLAESMGEDRRSAEVALEVLQGWLHDVAVAQVGGAGLVNLELKALAAQAATKVTPAGVLRRLVLVEEAKNAIAQRNGSARLQLERMFIEMFST